MSSFFGFVRSSQLTAAEEQLSRTQAELDQAREELANQPEPEDTVREIEVPVAAIMLTATRVSVASKTTPVTNDQWQAMVEQKLTVREALSTVHSDTDMSGYQTAYVTYPDGTGGTLDLDALLPAQQPTAIGSQQSTGEGA